jgi:hypothetical protein
LGGERNRAATALEGSQGATVGFEKGTGEDDSSLRMGGQGELSWFSSTDGPEIFCPQVRIEASGDEDSHRERLTQAGATTSNEGAPCPAFELTPDRRERDKVCGLTRFERGVRAFQSEGKAMVSATPGTLAQ